MKTQNCRRSIERIVEVKKIDSIRLGDLQSTSVGLKWPLRCLIIGHDTAFEVSSLRAVHITRRYAHYWNQWGRSNYARRSALVRNTPHAHTELTENKAIVDHTSSALCTPFPADPRCSERVTMRCQWRRAPPQKKNAPSPWPFVTLPEEDRATAVGNMHRKIGKDHASGFENILADRQAHRQAHRQTCSSQYFATASSGEVTITTFTMTTARTAPLLTVCERPFRNLSSS